MGVEFLRLAMSIFNVIVAVCWGAFIAFWMFSAIGVKRDLAGSRWWRTLRFRIVVASVVAGVLGKRLGQHLPIQSTMWTTHSHPAIAAAGALLCACGIFCAIWARVHLGRNWSPVPTLKEGHELVTSGPYRWLRHPIYTGMLLAMLGSTLVNPRWAIGLVAASGLFLWRVYREEALMTAQFPGEYPPYKKRTWALIPYVW